jgi:hypothetical protein
VYRHGGNSWSREIVPNPTVNWVCYPKEGRNVMKAHHKRFFRLLFFAVLSFSLAFGTGNCFGAVWYVDGDLKASGSGTIWPEALKTIQEAIDASIGGDEIWVKMGTYALSATINVTKPVSIYGGFAGWETQERQRDWQTNITTIDGQDTVRCFNVSADAVFDGVTIARGYPSLGGHWGGGIFNDNCNPTFINCIFSENGKPAGVEGGAIFNWNSSPQIINCTFRDNNAWSTQGGAILNYTIANGGDSSPVISGCTFYRNRAGGFGGAIYSHSSASSPLIINNCLFLYNHSTEGGGAISIKGGSTIISSCIFYGNSNYQGGGGAIAILDPSSSTIISNCIIYGNTTGEEGGGIFNISSLTTIVNCTIYGNIAGYNYGQYNPYHRGGGIYNSNSSPAIINSIIRDNLAGTGPEIFDSGGSPSVTYSNIKDGYLGEGNIDADPLFVDAANGDFHLQWESPCIDWGTKNALSLPLTDYEGDPRIIGPDPDMGADEFARHITIDIYPGTYPNVINLKAKGVVPVAILSSEGFRANIVDPNSVLFANAKPNKWSMKDVNGDGIEDMVLHFRIQDLLLDTSMTEASLSGVTKEDGIYLLGKDELQVIH